MKYDKKSIFAMILCWALLAVWFPAEARALIPGGIGKIGPMVFAIVPIGAYLLFRGGNVFQNRHVYSPIEMEDQLDHIMNFANVAGGCGLLGTVWSMIASLSSDVPDKKLFFEALYSTLFGSSIYFLALAFKSALEAPPLEAQEDDAAVQEKGNG